MVGRQATAALLVATLSLGAAALATPGSAQAAPAWVREDFQLAGDGGTKLAASVWHTPGLAPQPAILITNGWNNRHDQATELRLAERYAGQGYVVLGFTSRGWGNSDGDIELDGPKEQADTRLAVDYLASNAGRYNVLLDGPNDPRVGMVGESYGGAIQFLTAQDDPRLDSLVPRITWSNLLTALAPSDVFKVGWVSELYATGQTVGRGAPVPNQHPGDDPNLSGPSPKLSEWYATALALNGPSDEMRTEIGYVRSLHPGVLQTPSFFVQGWGDTLFDPAQALTNYRELEAGGVPARILFYAGGHGQSAPEGSNEFVDRAIDDWFNLTLRHRTPTLPPYPVLRYRATQNDFVGELQWPPNGTTTTRYYATGAGLSVAPPTAAASTVLVNSVGPGTCGDVPSFQGQASMCPYTTPQTSAVWSSEPLAQATEVTGEPVAHLELSSTQASDVRVFATLVDVDAAGKATLVWRQAVPIHLRSGTATSVEVPMVATSWTFAAGHRVGVQLSATDLAFFGSREGGAITITTSGDKPSWVDLPIVAQDAWGDRVPPAIHTSAFLPCRACATPTWEVAVNATDNLAIASFTATRGNGTVASLTSGSNLLRLGANETVRLRVQDFGGATVSKELHSPAQPPSSCLDDPAMCVADPEGTPAATSKATAAAGLASAIVAVGLALIPSRRRA